MSAVPFTGQPSTTTGGGRGAFNPTSEFRINEFFYCLIKIQSLQIFYVLRHVSDGKLYGLDSVIIRICMMFS